MKVLYLLVSLCFDVASLIFLGIAIWADLHNNRVDFSYYGVLTLMCFTVSSSLYTKFKERP